MKQLFLRASKSILFVWLLYLFFAIIFTYPGILHFSTRVIGDGGDNIEYYSYTLLVKENLGHLRWPYGHTTAFWYPDGFDMTTGSEAKLFTFFVALLSFVFPPVFSYNTGVITVLLLNAVCTYQLLKKLGYASVASFIGGMIYGMSYYVLAKAGGHINLMMVFPVPLFASCLLEAYKDRRITSWWLLRLAGVCIALLLSSVQYFFIVLSVMMLLLPIILLGIRRIQSFSFFWRNPLFVVYATGIGVVGLIIGIPYLRLAQTYPFSDKVFGLPRLVDAAHLISPNDYLIPFIYPYLYPTPLREGSIEYSLYLGIFEIVILILWIVWAKKNRYWLLIFFFSIALMLVSLGQPLRTGGLSLYGYLQLFFPFSIIWESERFFIIYYLFFTFFITAVLHAMRKNKAILVIALGFIILERFSGNFYNTDMSMLTGGSYAPIVAKMPTTAVLDVPFLRKDYLAVSPTFYNLLPMQYQKPIVGGYYHWLAENKTNSNRLSGIAEELFCDTTSTLSDEKATTIIDALLERGIRVVVVHKQILYDENCLSGRNQWYVLFELLTKKASVSRVFDDAEAEIFYLERVRKH